MYFKDYNIFKSGGTNNYRIPSILVDNDGTVIAFCNNRKSSIEDHAPEVDLVCCIRDVESGKWGESFTVSTEEGVACTIGNAVYDRVTGEAMCLVHKELAFHEFGNTTKEELDEFEKMKQFYGSKCGDFIISTFDGGKSFSERKLECPRLTVPDADGNDVHVTSRGHGSCPGIQLKHGEKKGRLLVPTRVTTGRSVNGASDLRYHCLNNSIYSDDHGKTWHPSQPVQRGTGEGTLMECCDGSIYYNSRAYYFDTKRRIAYSYDNGETYGNFSIDDFLIEEKKVGCNASLLHIDREQLTDEYKALLPDNAESITLFTNPRCGDAYFFDRCNMTVCYSFDEGKSWAGTKCIWGGKSSYSAMCFCEKSQRIYMLYEKGNDNCCEFGLNACEFDLEWVLS